MEKVIHILAEKGSSVFTVDPDRSVLEAARLMNRHQVGALVVSNGERVAGMFTERDVLQRVVAERRDPATTLVREVMTEDIVTASPDTSVDEARTIMRNRRVRHLPVVDPAQNLLGLISIGDLNAWRLNGHEKQIHYLEDYLYGRT